MPPNFPTSLDSLSNPASSTMLNDPTVLLHSSQHLTLNDIVEALEAKLGIGAGTAAINTILGGNGAGQTSYRQLMCADITPADRMALSADNPIHNGGFEVWQRGTSFPSLPDSGKAADRWGLTYGGSTSLVPNVTQVADVPAVAALVPGASYCFSMNASTADTSIAAGDYAGIYHAIEGYNWLPFQEKQFTIGFWVKAGITGLYSLSVQNAVGDRTCVNTYTINVANTWEYKTISFAASPNTTTGTWNTTNGVGLWVYWMLAGAGPTIVTSTLNTWSAGLPFAATGQVNGVNTGFSFRIWGVRMALGPTVPPYWPRSFGEELALCQRYCYVETPSGGSFPYTGNGFASSSTALNFFMTFPVPMRSAPTLTVTGAASGFTIADGVSSIVLSAAPTINAATPWGVRLDASVSAGATQYRPYNLRNNGASALTFSADL